MKKLLLILLCLPMIGFGQLTMIPDDNFEAYLETNGMGNGIANDDYVTTANINTVTSLYVNSQNIADLTGIEDFTALNGLSCYLNQLTSLDLSNNTALTNLRCGDNQLTSIDVSQNTALTFFNCSNNQLTSIDISTNTALIELFCFVNQLTSIDVSQNTALTSLICSYNQLTSLEVIYNTALTDLHCGNNQLVTLNVQNGNNINWLWQFDYYFVCINNSSLTCITVDDDVWSTANLTVASGNIDPQHYFSTNCPPPSAIQEHTTSKELLRTIDVLGRETKNQPLFYIYDDGTVEKRIVIE